MVDLIGFLSLGIFTAHITGNIVVIGALVVRHNRVNPAQILAIPVFTLAVATTWLIAKASGRRGLGLMRLLLLIQFLLIACLLVFSAITKSSADPHGLMATIAAMIAVTAMGCQFALLRLTLDLASCAFNRGHDGQLDECCVRDCRLGFADPTVNGR
jgi:uncharacterized membrane protein YoaK (UPF0700 family)